MKYALETKQEFDRLERQSRQPSYDFKSELHGLRIEDGYQVLDAGCGSGIVARYLAKEHPGTSVIGCDLGESRLIQAREVGAPFKNLRFETQDLSKLSYKTGTFDVVICRFVLHHLTAKTRQAALRELTRCLKPGGTLWIIEIDGLFHNIFPQTRFLTRCLRHLERSAAVDLHIGRKLPSLISGAGLAEIDYRIETLLFKENTPELRTERQLLAERLQGAREFFAKVLGTTDKAERFKAEYLVGLEKPGVVLFYNKFILTATKPKECGLRLISVKR